MKVISLIQDKEIMKKILNHLLFLVLEIKRRVLSGMFSHHSIRVHEWRPSPFSPPWAAHASAPNPAHD
jgi:hypothetical protein